MEGKKLFEDDTNSTFDNAFGGTPPHLPKEHIGVMNHPASFKIKVIKESRKSSVACASKKCTH